ncbi:peptidoglycan-associated lipoprotein Pal [Desulfococcaceae bacterium HSG9]|nr:peptidoglycan-associated lipoprotein Pal [Desulfococcaceae bacterium HSG9]
MQRSLMVILTLGCILPSFLTTVACTTKKTAGLNPSETLSKKAEAAAEERRQQQLLEEAGLAEQQSAIAQERERFSTDNVHFAYDSAILTPIGQNVLNRKAEWLRKNLSESVIIGGHCDERGTTEYNVALGERRAVTAKKYLNDLGISDSRLKTVSYGEEMPIDMGNNEEAWAQNRRAEFNIE